jgi:DNA-binding response OmpR family regulator
VHIAVAEDDPEQAALLTLWLEGGQHTARTFPTIAGCVAGLKAERFDLLLADWMLPDGTGVQLLE